MGACLQQSGKSLMSKVGPHNKKPQGRRPGRPRLRDQAAPITEIILDLALQEFGHHGFEGTNIADIAERAGVAKPLVHYHFETKEKL